MTYGAAICQESSLASQEFLATLCESRSELFNVTLSKQSNRGQYEQGRVVSLTGVMLPGWGRRFRARRKQAWPSRPQPRCALRPYPKLAKAKLKTRHVIGRILAYASPDSTYAVTKQLLDSAQHSIVIGIYDFSAGYMKAEPGAGHQAGG